MNLWFGYAGLNLTASAESLAFAFFRSFLGALAILQQHLRLINLKVMKCIKAISPLSFF